MNSYQLISKLRKIRNDTYLTAIDQALYYELVSICNEKGWKEVFDVRSSVLCNSLNIWDKTLRKSRKILADSGLIYFESCRDKRIGCYYSFLTNLSNDMKSSVNGTDENTGENTDDTQIGEIQSSVNDTVISSVLRTDENTDDKNSTPVISSVNGTDETQIPPIIDNINIKQEESLAHTHESTPPEKPKRSRKKEGDAKPLVYPFDSIAFMSAWMELVKTPKMERKAKLCFADFIKQAG